MLDNYKERQLYNFNLLDVRSLAVASRQKRLKSNRLYSNWRLSNMHIWEGLSVRALCAEEWRCVTDKVIEHYRTGLCCNDYPTYPSANTLVALNSSVRKSKRE